MKCDMGLGRKVKLLTKVRLDEENEENIFAADKEGEGKA